MANADARETERVCHVIYILFGSPLVAKGNIDQIQY